MGRSGSRTFVNSLPKSGTNLVASVLSEVEELRYKKLTLNRRLAAHPLAKVPVRTQCLVGVDQPKAVPVQLVAAQLRRLRTGEYTTGHLPYSEPLAEALRRSGIRPIFILRDPRDVVVSQVFHVMKRPGHFLHQAYRDAPSDRARFVLAIDGVLVGGGRRLSASIGTKLALVEPWLSSPDTLPLRFEDLVGSRGGGDAQQQERALRRILEWVGLEASDAALREIGERAFSTGSTFRRGQIGGWREHLDGELVDRIRNEAVAHVGAWWFSEA